MAQVMFIAGAGLEAFGQYNQGKALKQQAEAEKDILDYNASIKEKQADLELEAARAQAERHEKEGAAMLAEANVAIAKGGVLGSMGTPMMLMELNAQELDADRMAILAEGFNMQSFRLQEAEGLRFEGRAARSRGRNMKTASDMMVGVSLMRSMMQYGKIFGGGSSGGDTVGGQPRTQSFNEYRSLAGEGRSGSIAAFGGSSGGGGTGG